MTRKFSKKTSTKLVALGYYQIIGGVIGVALVVWLLFNLSSFNLLLLVIIVPAFLLFFFSMYCGTLLLKRNVSGIRWSIVNQWLQLFGFAFGGYAYQYVSGLYLTIGMDYTDSFTFLFGFGVSSWKLNINTGEPFIQFDINFIALYLIFLLTKLNNQVRNEQDADQIEELISPNI